MAVAFRAAAGATSSIATTQSYTLPTGHTTGDALFALYGCKYAVGPPTGGTVTTDYTLLSPGSGSDGYVSSLTASGNGVGGVRGLLYYKEHDGSETAPTVVHGSAPAQLGVAMVAYSKASNKQWSIAVAGGVDAAATGTGFAATADADPGYTSGDIVCVLVSRNDDPVHTAATITVPGCTVGTITQRLATTALTSGSDMNMVWLEAPITAGTSTGAPSVSLTVTSGDSEGPAIFVRLREIDPLTAVGDEISLRHSTRTAVSDTVALRANTRAAVSDESVLRYATRTFVGDEVAVRYETDSKDVWIKAHTGNASDTSYATWSLTLPTWVLKNDDYIVLAFQSSAGSSSPTAEPHNNGQGYTFVGRVRNNNGSTLGIYVKKATAGDVGAAVSVTYGTAQVQAAHAIILRNSAGIGASVFNPTANATESTTSIATLSSFTPQQATGSMIMGIIAARRTGTAPTASDPSGYSEVRVDYTSNGTATNLTLKTVRDTDGSYASTVPAVDSTLGNTAYVVKFHFEMLKAVSLSAVGDEISLPFNVLATLGDTSQLIYLTRALASDEIVLRANTRISAGDEIALRAATRTFVGDASVLRYAVRAFIGDTVELRSNTRSVVGDTAALRANTRAVIGDTVALRANTRAAVFDQIDLRASTRAATGDEAVLRYGVRTFIGDTVALRANTRAAAGDQIQLVYNVLGLAVVGDESVLRWNTRALASDSLQVIHGVRSALGDQAVLRFATRVLASDSSILRYSVRSAVGNPISLRHGVREALGDNAILRFHTRAAAGDTSTLRYHLRAAAGDSSILRYATRTFVGDSSVLRYAVRTFVGDSSILRFHTRAPAGDAVDLRWNVLSIALTATDSVVLRWNTRAPAADTLSLLYRTKTMVGDALILRYTLRTSAGDSVQLIHRTRAAVGDLVALRHTVRQAITENAQLLYHVRGAAAQEVVLRHHTLEALSDSIDLQYGTFVASGDTVDLRYGVREVAGEELQLLYDVISSLIEEGWGYQL